MSDTPRTDALTVLAQRGMIPACNIVPAVFARQLERELAEVTKQRDEVTMALQNLIESLNSTNWSSWQCTSRFWKQKDAAEATLAAMKGGAQ